jgi:hypothetical protein
MCAFEEEIHFVLNKQKHVIKVGPVIINGRKPRYQAYF